MGLGVGFGSVQQRDEKLSSLYPIHAVNENEAGKVDISKGRFDLSTFSGRLQHFYTTTSPLTLFAGSQKLKESQEYVKSVEANFPRDKSKAYLVTQGEAEKYWKAQQLVQSSVHPDTGEVIPLPFRMSAFVPTNLLVVGGMLSPNNTLAAVIFWQWVNQSLNVAVNYSNANKSVPMDMKEVGIAYSAATLSAVGIAVGLTRLVPAGTLISRFVPFVSVASAGCVNVSFMRWKEIRDGVSLFKRDEHGDKVKVGDSQIAGRRAVGMTAASRVMTNIPTMILPPLALLYLQKRRIVPQRGPWSRAADLGLIGVSLFAFLPPAIAFFPQTATIPASKVEAAYQSVKDDSGKAVETFEFNKGL
ncbi:hypothetical protein CBS101457_001108 [Exobasidium rhododendri]|nr:hypothetical protein CBS101457_001108 [Exobasidium rhododendri]